MSKAGETIAEFAMLTDKFTLGAMVLQDLKDVLAATIAIAIIVLMLWVFVVAVALRA